MGSASPSRTTGGVLPPHVIPAESGDPGLADGTLAARPWIPAFRGNDNSTFPWVAQTPPLPKAELDVIAMPTTERLSNAQAAHSFAHIAEPLRRELKLHCYRMLGSVVEAEDLVQETYLRAWRSFEAFEGGSFRAWLYRVATNVCLDAIASRKSARRWLPDQQGPATMQMPDGASANDIAWLELYPDSFLEGIADEAPNPEARYSSREAVQLAFVAAIQQLPPRQRAALLLADVLGWSAGEAADWLGGSIVSINSALQRARDTLAKRYPEGRPSTSPRPNPTQQKILGRYLSAWEAHDIDGFAALLKEDATFAMPPCRQWYAGRQSIRSFFATAWETCSGVRLVPCAANGQPAFLAYSRAGVGAPLAVSSIHVLGLNECGIVTMILFVQPAPRMIETFGVPLTPAHVGPRELA
jgi:RNA polymerase sigma-70 factor, ECF subfamily